MSSKTILPFVVTLAMAMCPPAYAGEAPKPASKEGETGAEAEARAENEAAEKAALAPLRKVMQQADAAYAEAKKTANAKRRKADRAKALAGEKGVKELEGAEAKVPAAAKAPSEATRPSLLWIRH